MNVEMLCKYAWFYSLHNLEVNNLVEKDKKGKGFSYEKYSEKIFMFRILVAFILWNVLCSKKIWQIQVYRHVIFLVCNGKTFPYIFKMFNLKVVECYSDMNVSNKYISFIPSRMKRESWAEYDQRSVGCISRITCKCKWCFILTTRTHIESLLSVALV